MFLKKIALVSFISVAAAYMTGCVGGLKQIVTEQQQERYQVAAKNDKEMLSAFVAAPVSKDQRPALVSDLSGKGISLDFSANAVHLKNKMFSVQPSYGVLKNEYRNYSNVSEADAIATKFVETAKKRGNKVKLYRPAMGKVMAKIFNPGFNQLKGSVYMYGVDPVLIEVDNSNRPVAFLSRAHHLGNYLGWQSWMYSNVYFGANMTRHFENNVRPSVLEANFIRLL